MELMKPLRIVEDSGRSHFLFLMVIARSFEFVRKTFMEIFAINIQCIKTSVAKKKSGEVIFEERCGGSRQKSTKYSVTERKLVRDHINSFLRKMSHYCRNQNTNNKEYLSPDLNICKLYRAFELKYPNTNVSRHYYYHRVFVTDFPNLSFKLP
ncbi:hypothetical protein PGB90_009682 [Kerria lacca]